MGTKLVYMRVRVAGVLAHDRGLLLVKHAKKGKTYWLLPGGGVGLGEHLQDALMREFAEELSLNVTVEELLFVVETVSPQGEHILQPTFDVAAGSADDILLGSDKRVVDFHFFRQDTIGDVVLYPDIKDELAAYLQTHRVEQRYVLKRWIE